MAIINSTIENQGSYNTPTYYGVSVTGASLFYQWQYSDNYCSSSDPTWLDLSNQTHPVDGILVEGAETDNLKLYPKYVNSNTSRVYRVIISEIVEDVGTLIFSDIFGSCSRAVISINSGSSSFSTSGNQGIFTITMFASVVIEDDTFTFPNIAWQRTNDNGITWENIIFSGTLGTPDVNNDGIIDILDFSALSQEGLIFERVESNILKINFNSNKTGLMKIRAIATYPGANPVFSIPIDLLFNRTQQQSTIEIVFTGQSIDPNGNTIYSVIGFSSDNSPIDYQWQYSENENDWYDIVNQTNQIEDSKTPSLRIYPQYIQQYQATRSFRCQLTSVSSDSVNSRIFNSIGGLKINFVYSGGINNSNPENSIGGLPSQNIISGSLNNLFSDVSRENSEFGTTDYRCFYITNDSNNADEVLYNASVYLQSEYNSQSSIQIGISRRSDIQILSLSNTPNTGYFLLRIGNVTTPRIFWSSNSNDFVNNIKNSLNNIDNVEVSVSKLNLNNYQISFVGSSANRNQDIIELVENNLSPTTNIIIEKQTEGQPINSTAPRIFNSQSPPSGVVFYNTNFANRLLLGDLYPNDIVSIWIRRYTYGLVSSDIFSGFNIRLTGNSNPPNLDIPNITQQQVEKPDFYYE